jgi:hypothetical protein
MVVGVYGVGYWIAAANPSVHWPIVLVGFLGKLLGPIGALHSVIQGRLPARLLLLNLMNDVIWLGPFAWILWAAWRQQLWNPASAHRDAPNLYRRLMGASFEKLHPHVGRFHGDTGPSKATGLFSVERGSNPLGRRLADCLGLPQASPPVSVTLQVERTDQEEVWRREFPGTVLRTRQWESHRFLIEQVGVVHLWLLPLENAGALEIIGVRATLFGVPLPPFLSPNVHATTSPTPKGMRADVGLTFPFLGLLLRYSGDVTLPVPTPSAQSIQTRTAEG